MRQAWVAFSIPGLEANLRKRFKNGQILVGKREYEVIFEEPLAGTSAVMEGQIKSCAAASISVDYVVLTGGFGGCPALKKRLEQNLQQLSTDNSHETRLITTNAKDSAVAVSRGAILRALNKEDGPARFLLMSFGILRHEPYDKSFEGHVWARQNNVDSKSKLDGISYVDHCIEWLIVNVHILLLLADMAILLTHRVG